MPNEKKKLWFVLMVFDIGALVIYFIPKLFIIEELPIAMLGYTSNAFFEVIDLCDFAATEQLSSFEYVYAVTVQFFPY